MYQYLKLIQRVLNFGESKSNRTGNDTLGLFGESMRFNLQKGFPIVTAKKTSFKLIATELLWFLSGSTNICDLHKHNNHIWDEWAREDGYLGPVYGKQWRAWGSGMFGVDQIKEVEGLIKTKPNSRRMVVSAWNPDYLPDEDTKPSLNPDKGLMALAPCHFAFQFLVHNGKLNCVVFQRSCDVFLGVPFNIASYALLTHLMAASTGMEVGELLWHGTDVHLYSNQIESAKQYLGMRSYALPKLNIKNVKNSVTEYGLEDFELVGYEHGPALKVEVSV